MNNITVHCSLLSWQRRPRPHHWRRERSCSHCCRLTQYQGQPSFTAAVTPSSLFLVTPFPEQSGQVSINTTVQHRVAAPSLEKRSTTAAVPLKASISFVAIKNESMDATITTFCQGGAESTGEVTAAPQSTNTSSVAVKDEPMEATTSFLRKAAMVTGGAATIALPRNTNTPSASVKDEPVEPTATATSTASTSDLLTLFTLLTQAI